MIAGSETGAALGSQRSRGGLSRDSGIISNLTEGSRFLADEAVGDFPVAFMKSNLSTFFISIGKDCRLFREASVHQLPLFIGQPFVGKKIQQGPDTEPVEGEHG